MLYYQYFKRVGIILFIDLNGNGRKSPVYKNAFTIDTYGVPLCPCGHRMLCDGPKVAKGRIKFNVRKSVTQAILFLVIVKLPAQIQSMDVQFIWY